jgi:hypothetical protein
MRLTKMGPESRSQTRSVGQWWKWRRARFAPPRLQDGGGAALGGEVVDQDVDVFDAGEMADDLGVDPGDGLELAGPVVGVVGPGDPGGGVRGPLGGHAVDGGGHGSSMLIEEGLVLAIRGSRFGGSRAYPRGFESPFEVLDGLRGPSLRRLRAYLEARGSAGTLRVAGGVHFIACRVLGLPAV